MAALPYPAYVYERNLWLGCRFIAGWRRNALSGLRLRAQPVARAPLYCRMAAQTPYPAWVYGRKLWLRGCFIAGWRRNALSGLGSWAQPVATEPLYCRMAA